MSDSASRARLRSLARAATRLGGVLLLSGTAAALALALTLRRLQRRAQLSGRQLATRRRLRLAARRAALLQPLAAQPTLRIAVLGGGVAGLAAAWTLATALRRAGRAAQLVVVEAGAEVGGQLRTLQGSLPPPATRPLRLETGPRSLRTTTEAAELVLRLLQAVGAQQLLRWAEPAARGRRFVRQTQPRPTSAAAAATAATAEGEPVFVLEELPSSLPAALAFAWRHGAFGALLRDVLHFGQTEHVAQWAESLTVHSFFARHFSPHLASRFASALVHGIFSGDSKQLLLRYAFPGLWRTAAAYGSVVVGSLLDGWLHWSQQFADAEAREVMPSAAILDAMWGPQDTVELHRLLQRARRERVASLEGGLSTLVTALYDAANAAGVQFAIGSPAIRIGLAERNPEPSGDTHEQQLDQRRNKQRQQWAAVVADSSTEFQSTSSKVPEVDTSLTATHNTANRHALEITCADDHTIECDLLLSTLPPAELSQLLQNSTALLAATAPAHQRAQAAVLSLCRMRSLSIAVVSFVFQNLTFEEATQSAVLTPASSSLRNRGNGTADRKCLMNNAIKPGFGFLVPASDDRGLLLGVIYDSCIFPELAGPQNLVLTAMLGGAETWAQQEVDGLSDQQLIERGWLAVQTHLHVRAGAAATRLTRWRQAIPQFDAAYARARGDLDDWIANGAPWLFVAGKAFGSGVGINDSIASSVHAAADMLHSVGVLQTL